MIFVAYRENDLFRKYLPKVLEGLPIVGTFIIPEGTELEDRKDDFIAAINTAVANGATKFLTDRTCSLREYSVFSGNDRINGQYYWDAEISIDEIFRNEVCGWLGVNSVADNLGWFAGMIAEGRTVEKIVIVANRLADHRFEGEGSWEYRFGAKHTPVLEQRMMDALGDKYPSASMEVVDTLEDAMVHAEEDTTMLVVDRHSGIKDVMQQEYEKLSMWTRRSMLYMLPFETTAAQLIDRGTLPYSFNADRMRAEIEVVLAKSF